MSEELFEWPDFFEDIDQVKKGSHAGIGSPGPNCHTCDSGTVWLSGSEAVVVYYQCETCRRVYEFWTGLCIWWPNEEGIEPPLGGLGAIANRLRQPRSYTIAVTKPKPIMESFAIRVKEAPDR